MDGKETGESGEPREKNEEPEGLFQPNPTEDFAVWPVRDKKTRVGTERTTESESGCERGRPEDRDGMQVSMAGKTREGLYTRPGWSSCALHGIA